MQPKAAALLTPEAKSTLAELAGLLAATEFTEPALEGAEAAACPLVSLLGFFIRVQDDDAAIAVDDDKVATGNIRYELAETHHGRYLQSACWLRFARVSSKFLTMMLLS